GVARGPGVRRRPCLDARLPLRALGPLERRHRVATGRLGARQLGVLLCLVWRPAPGDRDRSPAPNDLSRRRNSALTSPTRRFHRNATNPQNLWIKLWKRL